MFLEVPSLAEGKCPDAPSVTYMQAHDTACGPGISNILAYAVTVTMLMFQDSAT